MQNMCPAIELPNEEFLRNMHQMYRLNGLFRLLLDSCFYFKIPLFYSSGGSWRVCHLREIREYILENAPPSCVNGLLNLLSRVFPSNRDSRRMLLGDTLCADYCNL